MPAAPEYCPVSIAASVVCERWNLLILREMLAGARGFNEIHRGLPGLSRTLLSARLRTLQQAGLITTVAEDGTGRQGYTLTPKGADLHGVVLALGTWSVRWSFPEPTDDQLDPNLLLWRMRSGIARDQLPDRRVTVELTFDQDPKPVLGWLVLSGDDSSVCTRHPLFDVDIHAHAPSRIWHELWYGHLGWRDAIEGGELKLTGEAELLAGFPTWFQLSPFAGNVAERTAGGAHHGTA
ncbi:MAG TPA: helix-turn-helix domain-containing protein [Pseudonocardia sp.]|jgi:DNA-binding HxlR family transcriptional regulator|nr:helix-turn-helix domain-containing protein [Pseudonocardia sp.]